jgi:hypothetical protein
MPQHTESNEIGGAASRDLVTATPERWSEGHLARRARGGPEEGKELLPPLAYRLSRPASGHASPSRMSSASGLARLAAALAGQRCAGALEGAHSSGYGTPQSSADRPPA